MIGLANAGETDTRCIHVGLLNNMPDSALDATERQFRELLAEAAEGIPVRLSLFALPELKRSSKTKQRMQGSYSSVDGLLDNRLDGLIVTGAEPLAPNLVDEPYWSSLTRVIDWAEQNTYSSIWSCLAAHAAVLRLDGIGRRTLTEKLFGVFECENAFGHPLTAGLPDSFWMPHSRWNEVPECGLPACGYQVLTRSKDAGVDAFCKQSKSLFVFLQGHPEYETGSLLLEYRRDIRKFHNGESDSYPAVPKDYFDAIATGRLDVLRARVLDGHGASLADLAAPLRAPSVLAKWRPAAVRLYRNWLRYVSEQKGKKSRAQPRTIEYNRIGGAINSRLGPPASGAEAGFKEGCDGTL